MTFLFGLIMNPRAALLALCLPVLAGLALLHPETVSAFVLGAWVGFLIAGPPLALLLWALRLQSLGETLAPLRRLPVLLAVSAGILFLAGFDPGVEGVVASAGAGLWWFRYKLTGALV